MTKHNVLKHYANVSHYKYKVIQK